MCGMYYHGWGHINFEGRFRTSGTRLPPAFSLNIRGHLGAFGRREQRYINRLGYSTIRKKREMPPGMEGPQQNKSEIIKTNSIRWWMARVVILTVTVTTVPLR